MNQFETPSREYVLKVSHFRDEKHWEEVEVQFAILLVIFNLVLWGGLVVAPLIKLI